MTQRRFMESKPSTADRGAAALDLIHQAADVFRDMEQRARETEARAQSLCNSAIEKVRSAEMRAEAAESAHRTLIIEAEDKIRRASRALEEARSRLEAKEDQLAAMEFRAQAAEVEARETRQALALVEEAIRRRLLFTSPAADARLTEVA
jgi:septal ring factor EnvC (AmiA/AmiB activator)